MDTPWRERIPLPYAPRHPLWLDAYFAAWELLAQGAPKGPDSCLLALCLRYAGEGAAWLEGCEPSVSLAWCEWQCFQHSADAARLVRVLPGPVERFEDLLGDFWPEDETCDEFIAWLREGRQDRSGEAHR